MRSLCETKPSPEVVHLAIALRIGGSIQDFSPENIHRIRRSRKDKSIGCDIDIPQAVWEAKSNREFNEYLGHRVREAVILMLERLKKDGEEVNDLAILAELDESISQFQTSQENLA